MEAFILDLAAKYPVVVTVLAVIGVLRVVLKPLFSVAHALVDQTESKADNELLDKVEQSPVVKGIFYVLDWFGSIKLKKPGA